MGAVTILVDGEAVWENATFGFISAYHPMSAGQRNVSIITGSGNGSLLIESLVNFTASTFSTLSFLGLQDNPDYPLEIRNLIDPIAPPNSGQQGLIKFVHLAPDLHPVQVKAGEVVIVDELDYGGEQKKMH